MKILRIVYLLMPLSLWMSFLWAPKPAVHGDAGLILYFHVPLAWISVLAFFVSGVFSIIYLYDRDKRFYLLDKKFHNSAKIGIVFTILATVTGAIWSKISWGAYWNWDIRQKTIVILMMIYFAYLSLHYILESNPNRGRISSVYLIFAMVTTPFLIFILPRMSESLHPRSFEMDIKIKITLLISLFSFTVLYFYLLGLLNRVSGLSQRIEEKFYEK